MIRFGCCLLVATCCFGGVLSAQNASASSAGRQISFRFDHSVAGVTVPRYTIVMRGDGTGTYHAEVTSTQSPDMQTVERPLVFSATGLKNAFVAVHLLRSSGEPCASKVKNVADTGTKVLEYRDAEGDGACTFNFSENKGAVQLTDFFQGVETTLDEGRVLAFKHRFDRLGLDAEMESLVTAVEAGRALELGNIASTLRSIAADTELMQRVRLRAGKLLEQAQVAP